jgi:HAD superfamily phosphoserine phosphatase-like hydrolase
MVKKKELAILDVDKSLINTTSAFAILAELTSKNIFPQDVNQELFKHVAQYMLPPERRTDKEMDQKKMVRIFAEHWAKGLKGIEQKKVEEVADEVARRLLDENSYRNLEEAIKFLHENKLTPVLFSGSPKEIVDAMVSHLRERTGIEEIYGFGAEAEVRDGRYTGKAPRPLMTRAGKFKILRDVVEPSLEGEVKLVFGDSQGDIGAMMLKEGRVVKWPDRSS